jgi:hypothetical protein
MRRIRVPLVSAWEMPDETHTIMRVACDDLHCHGCIFAYSGGGYCSAFDVRLVDGMRADECKKAEVEE